MKIVKHFSLPIFLLKPHNMCYGFLADHQVGRRGPLEPGFWRLLISWLYR